MRELKSRHSYLEGNKNVAFKEYDEKLLVCVFDSLRDTVKSNVDILKNSKKIGEFQSLPEFGLFEIAEQEEPVLLADLTQSVIFDVYEISEKILEDLNKYYGFVCIHSVHNINNRDKIDTPYGEAYVFTNNRKLDSAKLIDSGDWTDYFQYKMAVENKPIKLHEKIKQNK